MFGYYLDLAWRSFRRNKLLTTLMIVTIGFGVGASMTTWAVFRAVSGDPIPQKSAELFVPQIDNWGPPEREAGGTGNGPPDAMDYIDAVALMRAHRARYQSAMYQLGGMVVPKRVGQHPAFVVGEAVSSEFFPMLDVPFKYGSGWSDSGDQRRAQVVVISDHLNNELFGGGDNVGKTFTFNAHEYRVIGVLDHWNPQPVFYDAVNNRGGFSDFSGNFFIPFTTAIAMSVANVGSTRCNEPPTGLGLAGIEKSDCVWISFMVQLDNSAAVHRYHRFLVNYAAEQQRSGRFHWPPDVRLRGRMAWLKYLNGVPPNTRIALYVGLGLLLVCLVNTTGLLLAKFLRRSGEIGVRRALGASRVQIYAQFLVEAGMVGLAGGVLGLVLTTLGVAGIGWVMPHDIAMLAHMDASLLFTTLCVAIVATLLAGLYPVIRAAAVQPAWQLKTN